MRTSFFALLMLSACEMGIPTSAVDVGEDSESPGDVGLGESRPRRRMDLTQLDASMRRASGGIGWDDGAGNSLFRANARTLGVPDYVTTSQEETASSSIFLKFLGDASQAVCTAMIAREADPAATEHVLFREATLDASPSTDRAKVANDIARLLLRFHGHRSTASSVEVTRWVSLWADARALSPEDPKVAWTTLCVGLFTHPDFYLY